MFDDCVFEDCDPFALPKKAFFPFKAQLVNINEKMPNYPNKPDKPSGVSNTNRNDMFSHQIDVKEVKKKKVYKPCEKLLIKLKKQHKKGLP